MSSANPKPGGQGGSARQIGLALTLGTQLVVPVLIGWWLDNQFGWAPAGVLVGGVFGFLLVLLQASRLIEPDKTDPKDRQPPPENPS